MKPDLDFEIIDAVDDQNILKIRVFGTVNGTDFDEILSLPQPMTAKEVHAFVAKANNGRFRPSRTA